MEDKEADVCSHLSRLLPSVAQCGAIVGKMESMVGDSCRFLHIVHSQTFLNQLFLLLRLSVVVKIDGPTGHCVATYTLGVNGMLGLLLVRITTTLNLL
jgi:hypothetical protein